MNLLNTFMPIKMLLSLYIKQTCSYSFDLKISIPGISQEFNCTKEKLCMHKEIPPNVTCVGKILETPK